MADIAAAEPEQDIPQDAGTTATPAEEVRAGADSPHEGNDAAEERGTKRDREAGEEADVAPAAKKVEVQDEADKKTGDAQTNPDTATDAATAGSTHEGTALLADPAPQGGVLGGHPQQAAYGEDPYAMTTYEDEVPRVFVGCIIGRGGETIKMIQYTSGAHLNLQKDSDAVEGCQVRKVTFNGNSMQIQHARQMVQDLIDKEKERYAAREVAMGAGGGSEPQGGRSGQWLVPTGNVPTETVEVEVRKVGLVIGPGGSVIKEIRTRTGCRIKVADESLNGISRSITITGQDDARELAKQMMLERIGSFAIGTEPISTGKVMRWNEANTGARKGADQSGYAAAGYGAAGYGAGYGYGGYASGAAGYTAAPGSWEEYCQQYYSYYGVYPQPQAGGAAPAPQQ